MHSTKDGNGQAEKPATSLLRRTDHFDDMDNGSLFDRIPKQVMMAYIDGLIPSVKFRLLCAIIIHKKTFKVKSAYLRNRFTSNALKKYIPELKADGIITVEKVPLQRGGHENVYHVNSISKWREFNSTSQTACSETNSTPQTACSETNSTPQTEWREFNSTPQTEWREFNSTSQTAWREFNSCKSTPLNETKRNENNSSFLSTPPSKGEDESDGCANNVVKEEKKVEAQKPSSKAETPPGDADAGKPNKKTAEALFRSHGSYFKGGYGRYDYTAQRNFWKRIVDARLIDEAKYVLDCIHGPGKPPACSGAAERRMSDNDYADYLFDESKAVRDRKEHDIREQARWHEKQQEMEATKEERAASREAIIEKLKKARESLPKRRF